MRKPAEMDVSVGLSESRDKAAGITHVIPVGERQTGPQRRLSPAESR